jgi:hypothetical protein
VTSPLSSCTPSLGADSTGGIAPWTLSDAGVSDGSALTWIGTCCNTAPPPDGGSCAWVDDRKGADCAVLWAPCPPDGGSLCPWWYADGGMTLGACPEGADAGVEEIQGNGSADTGAPPSTKGAGATPDASAPSEPGDQPGGANVGAGGCSIAKGADGESFAPLLVLSILGGFWRTRRKGTRTQASR